MNTSLSAGGIILDIAGAVFLALGFMVRQEERMEREASTHVGLNPFLLRSLVEQKADAQVGLLFLVSGFAVQLAAALGVDPAWASGALVLPVAIVLSSLGAVAVRYRRRALARPPMVRLVARNLLELRGRGDPPATNEDFVVAVERLGEYPAVPRRENESLSSFGRRVVGAKAWQELALLLPCALRADADGPHPRERPE